MPNECERETMREGGDCSTVVSAKMTEKQALLLPTERGDVAEIRQTSFHYCHCVIVKDHTLINILLKQSLSAEISLTVEPWILDPG
jgi:hypothetical protein